MLQNRLLRHLRISKNTSPARDPSDVITWLEINVLNGWTRYIRSTIAQKRSEPIMMIWGNRMDYSPLGHIGGGTDGHLAILMNTYYYLGTWRPACLWEVYHQIVAGYASPEFYHTLAKIRLDVPDSVWNTHVVVHAARIALERDDDTTMYEVQRCMQICPIALSMLVGHARFPSTVRTVLNLLQDSIESWVPTDSRREFLNQEYPSWVSYRSIELENYEVGREILTHPLWTQFGGVNLICRNVRTIAIEETCLELLGDLVPTTAEFRYQWDSPGARRTWMHFYPPPREIGDQWHVRSVSRIDNSIEAYLQAGYVFADMFWERLARELVNYTPYPLDLIRLIQRIPEHLRPAISD